jgi:hypothetical protein
MPITDAHDSTKVDADSPKRKWRSGIYAFLFVFTLLMVGNYLTDSFKNPYVHPQFVAEPYEAPKGCEVREYWYRNEISIFCADERYIFNDWKKYGLPYPGRWGPREGRQLRTYYRVGNHLISIYCLGKICKVNNLEKNVFIVGNQSKKGLKS